MPDGSGDDGQPVGAPSLMVARLMQRLETAEGVTPKYRALADFILRHPEEGALLTATEMAKAVGVSEATVIRFAGFLSYSGYPEFQRDFQRMLRSELTTIRRLGRALEQPSADGALDEVLRHEVDNLRALPARVPHSVVHEVAVLMLHAPVIYVAGLRASACLASYLAYQARVIAPDVVAITTGGADAKERIRGAPDAVLVAFAFPRYPRELIELVDHARECGVTVVGITDGFSSPLRDRADHAVFAPSSSPGVTDLYGAAMAVCAALIHETSRIDHERALAGLTRFERFAEDVDLYEGNR